MSIFFTVCQAPKVLTSGRWEWRILLGLMILRVRTGVSGRLLAERCLVAAELSPAPVAQVDHWKLIQHTTISCLQHSYDETMQ